ncbi:MAG: PIN domain-containing protein, partial [Armatimonadetes bacterium]|nr:PIN domain-containing protein [Armatimonadota bacterium]
MQYVTDTHPLIWLLANDVRLSDKAAAAFDDATARIAIPSIVLAEISYLYRKQRFAVSLEDVVRHVEQSTQCSIYPLDLEVARHLPPQLRGCLGTSVRHLSHRERSAVRGRVRAFPRGVDGPHP